MFFRLYNQAALIDKINLYLEYKGRETVLEHGYCHGLTLLWLYKMSEGKEQWFYDIVRKIGRLHTEELDEFEMDVEKFIAHIEWMQNPHNYVKGLNQLDIDQVIEKPLDYKLSYQFDRRQLEVLLDKIIPENEMICLSGPDHTVGVYKRDVNYYFYDSNYIWGSPMVIDTERRLKTEIIYRLFRVYSSPIDKLSLHINAFKSEQRLQESKDQRQGLPVDVNALLKEIKDVNKLSENGTSTFYLACVNADEEMIKKLIADGADVNQLFRGDNVSALSVAAVHNYPRVVKLLLDNKADPEVVLIGNCTVLHFAANLGYDDIVKMLLERGATPLKKNRDGDTPLYSALESEQWDTAALLMAYIPNFKAISRNDVRDLHECQEEMITAVQKILPKLLPAAKNHLIYLMKEVYRRNLTDDFESLLLVNDNKNRFFAYRKTNQLKETEKSYHNKPRARVRANPY